MSEGLKRVGWMAVLTLSLVGGLARADSWIVRDGVPQAEIVVSDQAVPMIRLAAEQLQHSIREMSGATVPVVYVSGDAAVQVYVGRSSYTDKLGIEVDDLDHGAYRMLSGDGWLALVGRDIPFFDQRDPRAVEILRLATHRDGRPEKDRFWEEWYQRSGGEWGSPYSQLWKGHNRTYDVRAEDEAGTFNAIAAFLRMQGMRWYYPGPVGQVIPEIRNIVVPAIDEIVRPDYPVRYARVRFGRPSTTLWYLWMGFSHAPDVTDAGFQGHGIGAVTEFDGGMWMHPRAKPEPLEYYALYGGRRNVTGRFCGKQCLSSEALFEENVRFCRAVFDVFDAPMVSVMPCDGYTSICQCPKCEGKARPDMGPTGKLSNHVWDYVNRVAKEVYKTHPDRFITCCSYGSYRVPPTNIDEFSPNVVVNFCQHRSRYGQRLDARDEFRGWRRGFAEKFPRDGKRRIFTWEYYRVPQGVPAFSPHAIAEDLRAMQDISLGDKIDVSLTGARVDSDRWDSIVTSMAVHHLNLYVTGRCWWDANLDVDAVLEEYCTRYYGPAAEEIKALIAYAEDNWMNVLGNKAEIDKVLAFMAAAQAEVDPESVYGKRVALLAQHTDPLKNLREQLDFVRLEGPELLPLERGYEEIVVDGKLDDPFWQKFRRDASGSLRECQTGRKPGFGTSFKVGWGKGNLYFGIRCEELGPEHIRNAATEHDQTNIWNGDCIEIHLEPPGHRWYQIAISPDGTVVDLDRELKGALDRQLAWESNAEVATTIDANGWTVEVCIPAAGEEQGEVLPLLGVAGSRPVPAYPWYFNVFRQRMRGQGNIEVSAFSPTGQRDVGYPEAFAKMYMRK